MVVKGKDSKRRLGVSDEYEYYEELNDNDFERMCKEYIKYNLKIKRQDDKKVLFFRRY